MKQLLKKLFLKRDSKGLNNPALGFIFGLLVAVVIAAFEIFSMYEAYSPKGDEIWIWYMLPIYLILIALLLAVPILAFLSFIKRMRRFTIPALLFCLTSVLGFLILPKGDHYRIEAMKSVAQRGQPIIDGIRSYEAKYGHSPKALADLIPEYLSEIPTTGLKDYQNFDYSTGSDVEKYTDGNLWILSVFPPCAGGFDMFQYYPKENYPLKKDRNLELISGWVYVHE